MATPIPPEPRPPTAGDWCRDLDRPLEPASSLPALPAALRDLNRLLARVSVAIQGVLQAVESGRAAGAQDDAWLVEGGAVMATQAKDCGWSFTLHTCQIGGNGARIIAVESLDARVMVGAAGVAGVDYHHLRRHLLYFNGGRRRVELRARSDGPARFSFSIRLHACREGGALEAHEMEVTRPPW